MSHRAESNHPERPLMGLHAPLPPLNLLKRAPEQSQTTSPDSARQSNAQTTEPDRHLVCSTCAFPITTGDQRTQVIGSHQHTFANPHGLVFRIGCYRAAPGCMPVGPESTEFAWFVGYAWTVQVCGRCAAHLGWSFRSSLQLFYGLIVDRLLDAPTGPQQD
jgi:hypothetical protein